MREREDEGENFYFSSPLAITQLILHFFLQKGFKVHKMDKMSLDEKKLDKLFGHFHYHEKFSFIFPNHVKLLSNVNACIEY